MTNDFMKELKENFQQYVGRLQTASDLYQKYAFCEDFIRRCEERKEQGDLLHIPCEGLDESPYLLSKAYQQYCKWADCNVAYNTTLDLVVDEMERRIASGDLSLAIDKKYGLQLLVYFYLLPDCEHVFEKITEEM